MHQGNHYYCLHRDQFLYVPSQWETTLQCNVVSHWLGAFIKWSLLTWQCCHMSIKVSHFTSYLTVSQKLTKINNKETTPNLQFWPFVLGIHWQAVSNMAGNHDGIIKWRHFPRYWPFVWGIHRSPVNSPHKCQWCGALMFSLICFWINHWVNNRETGDLRSYLAHYDVTVMCYFRIVTYADCHMNHKKVWHHAWNKLDDI